MKQLTAIIVDDEQKARNLLEKLIKEVSDLNVIAKAESVNQAFQLIITSQPDIVFLDIEMPNKNGFELVRMLKKASLIPIIVFITAYDKYAVEAFRCAAFDYLLKPVDKADLLNTINRIKQQTGQQSFHSKVDLLFDSLNQKNKIKLNTREGYILIDPKDIIYCKADGSYTEIHLTTGSTEVSTFHLGKIEGYLATKNFFRISRSAIINLDFLKEVNRKKKTCTLLFDSKEMIFDIPRKQIKELEKL